MERLREMAHELFWSFVRSASWSICGNDSKPISLATTLGVADPTIFISAAADDDDDFIPKSTEEQV